MFNNGSSEYASAGTDHPYYFDSKSGKVYSADWNLDEGFPFGYWKVSESNGTYEFAIGDLYSSHVSPCGKLAEKYCYEELSKSVSDDASLLSDGLDDLVRTLRGDGNYRYDEDYDVWVSEDGSDEIDIDDWVREMDGDTSYLSKDYIRNLVDTVLDGGDIPSEDDIVYEIVDGRISNYDFTTQLGIRNALSDCCGMTFSEYFEDGYGEGRVWTDKRLICFYETEQPSREDLPNLLKDLCNASSLSYDDLLGYHMIFENWSRGDGRVTCCTVSDYISGNYGENVEDDDGIEGSEIDSNGVQYARQGKTVFVPHLASQGEKRAYFKDFRDVRDRSLYVPRERGAGSLARYHALRYPYGESVSRKVGMIIREELNKLGLLRID